MRMAVVGGGIAGLAAAWQLRNQAEVVVYEPDALGGKVRTSLFEGRPVDEGADAFVTRSPGAMALCDELGLSAELVAPAAGRTLLWAGGRLRLLPEGLVLGVPRRLGPVARSRLLTSRGLARAALDLVLPASAPGDDVSVGDLVRRRFGREVADRLVEPLVGGIHAAGIAELSTASAAPQLLAAVRQSHSLLLALRAQARRGAPAGPLFLTPRLGLGQLVDALVERLHEAGVTFARDRVTALRPLPGGKVAVGDEAVDGAVVATSAPDAARVLGDEAPAELAGIELTSVTVLTLAFAEADLDVPEGVNGVLVPPGEDRLVTAISFGSSKWPQWAAPGQVVLRASVGRHGDDRAATLDDTELISRVVTEIHDALHARGEPLAARVSRWPGSLPFYRVGHANRVTEIDTELGRRLPTVALAGSSYAGAGIPACIVSGRAAATAVLAAASRHSPAGDANGADGANGAN